MLHRFSQNVDPYEAAQPLDGGFVGHRTDIEREHPLVQHHDVESADLQLAMGMATEACNVSGAILNVHQRTNNAGADDVWDEDADPTYWAPIKIKGFFPPGAIEVALKLWGAEAPVPLDIYFSTQNLLHYFGKRILRIGDVIQVPFNAIGNIQPKYFRVVNVTPIGNYRYVWLYQKCTCQSLTGDITVQPRDGATTQMSDFQHE